MKRRVNVLMIAPMFPPLSGGGSTQAYYLVQALGKRVAVRVDVVAPPQACRTWLSGKRVSVHPVTFEAGPGEVPFKRVLDRCLDICRRLLSEPGFSSFSSLVVHAQHFEHSSVCTLSIFLVVLLVVTLHKTPIEEALGTVTREDNAAYCHMHYLARLPIDAFVAGSEVFERELDRLGVQREIVRINHGVPIQWLRSRAESARKAASEHLGIDPRRTDLILCPVRWEKRKEVGDL